MFKLDLGLFSAALRVLRGEMLYFLRSVSMDWREFSKKLLLADGRLGVGETKLVKRLIMADGKVDSDEAAFLLEVKRAAREVHPDFTQFLQDIIRKAILRDGSIDPPEVAWLRKMVLQDRVVDAAEMAFLIQLGREAKRVCSEFVHLLKECESAGLVPLTPANG
jgi:hypothetical protein